MNNDEIKQYLKQLDQVYIDILYSIAYICNINTNISFSTYECNKFINTKNIEKLYQDLELEKEPSSYEIPYLSQCMINMKDAGFLKIGYMIEPKYKDIIEYIVNVCDMRVPEFRGLK